MRVDRSVVIVAEFGRGNSETGEDDFSREIHILPVPAQNLGKFPLRFLASAREGDETLRAVGAVFN